MGTVSIVEICIGSLDLETPRVQESAVRESASITDSIIIFGLGHRLQSERLRTGLAFVLERDYLRSHDLLPLEEPGVQCLPILGKPSPRPGVKVVAIACAVTVADR